MADPDGNRIEVITRRAPRAAATPAEDDLDLGDDLAGLELWWGSVGRPSMVEHFNGSPRRGPGYSSMYSSSKKGVMPRVK